MCDKPGSNCIDSPTTLPTSAPSGPVYTSSHTPTSSPPEAARSSQEASQTPSPSRQTIATPQTASRQTSRPSPTSSATTVTPQTASQSTSEPLPLRQQVPTTAPSPSRQTPLAAAAFRQQSLSAIYIQADHERQLTEVAQRFSCSRAAAQRYLAAGPDAPDPPAFAPVNAMAGEEVNEWALAVFCEEMRATRQVGIWYLDLARGRLQLAKWFYGVHEWCGRQIREPI